jgi:hypothetical protein
MAENPLLRRADAADAARARCETLRTLAGWYREFAERAGNTGIWEARLRTAEDLEAEAARIETPFAEGVSPAAASAENLRAEARQLLNEVKNAPDCETKRQLAINAFALSQRAEVLTVWRENPAIISLNAERYRTMLAQGIDDAAQRRLLEEMLADARAALAPRQLAAK